MFNIILFLLISTTSFASSTRSLTFDYASKFSGVRNYVINSDAEKNLNNVTSTLNSFTRDTSNEIQGDASFSLLANASGQNAIWATSTFAKEMYGQNCIATFLLSGTATAWKAYVRQNSVQITSDLTLSNPTTGNTTPVIIPFACGDGSSGATDVVVQATSSSPGTIYVDHVYIGLSPTIYADFKTPMSNAGAVTVTGTSSNPTKGAVTIDEFWWARDGEFLLFNYNYRQTTAGANGTGDYLFTIPSVTGCTINTTKSRTNTTVGANSATDPSNVGSAGAGITGTEAGTGYISVYSSTQFRIMVTTTATTVFESLNGSDPHYGLGEANTMYTAQGRVPCDDWDSSPVILNTSPRYRFVGSAYFATTANCLWSRTNTILGAFGTDADCPGPTVEFNPGGGTIQTTDANLPQITVNNLAAGLYKITATGYSNLSGAADPTLAISDGTTTSGNTGMSATTTAAGFEVIGFFYYSSSGNRTFALHSSSSANAVQIINNANNSRLQFVVEKVSDVN